MSIMLYFCVLLAFQIYPKATSNFRSLEVVNRGCDTEFQVSENLNIMTVMGFEDQGGSRINA